MKLQVGFRSIWKMKRPKRSIYKLLYYINIIILFSVYILINHFGLLCTFWSLLVRTPVRLYKYTAIYRGQFAEFSLEKIDAEAFCSVRADM